MALPCTTPARVTGRKIRPSVIPAAAVQTSTRALTPAGTVTVRTRLPLPRDRDGPTGLALFKTLDVQPRQLRPAQPTADEQGEDGAVALAVEGSMTGRVEQVIGLFFGEPIPQPGAAAGHAGHTFDRRDCYRIEQPVVGHLADEAPDGSEAQLERRRGEPGVKQCGPVLPD